MSKILGWLVLKNRQANLFHLKVADSTQLECAKAVIK